MSIRLGISVNNPAALWVGAQPVNKVFVGSVLVWQKIIFSSINHGYLYNHYAAADPRGIAPAGWHLPTQSDQDELFAFLGNASSAGCKLKTVSGWGNFVNGTDDFSFHGIPSGTRWGNANVDFTNIDSLMSFWNSAESFYQNYLPPHEWRYFGGGFYVGSDCDLWQGGDRKFTGMSIRHIKDNSINPGYMRDFDGNIYPTCTIGNQVWMAANLKVTHFNDGSEIPYVSDSTAWHNLTSAALCAYNNNPANV